jgi:AcrR family transcriptional regulator/ribosomal protein S18 acetylase RimI-like enzyme
MATDDELRTRIIDAAAELFAEHGYEGTRLRMVAAATGLPPRTVRRLTGGRPELFAAVMAEKVRSDAGQRLADAVLTPADEPGLSVLLEAGRAVFTAPSRSWDVLELEAMTRAHRDPAMRRVESERIAVRRANARSLIAQLRASGTIDADVDDETLTHFVLALSVGMAMVDPVLASRPRAEDWNGLIARIAVAMAPADLALPDDDGPRRPWRVRIDVPDQPGAVARLARALAALHVHTIGMQVVQASEGVRTVDIALTAPGQVDPDEIRAAVRAAGRNVFLTEGSDQDAMDLPTRVLDGATVLATYPGWAPQAAAQLVEADRFEVVDPNEGTDDRANVLRLQWTPDRHVLLQRSWAPFARAEQTRASALLRLSAAIATLSGDVDALGWVEAIGGGTVWIRLAHPEDAELVAAMHARSSERTRYLRYVSLGQWRDVQLRRLAGGHRGATLVAMSEEGAIVGLGNVFPAGESDAPSGSPEQAAAQHAAGDAGAAELALIIEDAYQRRGLGTRMLRHQIALAQRLGFTEVVAIVLAENTGMLELLRRTGLAWTHRIDAGTATWRAPLPPRPEPPA